MLGAGAGAEPPYVSWLILLRDQAMAMEKRRQVVADTLWTVPAADMAHTIQNTTWGEERRGEVTVRTVSLRTHLAQLGLEVEAKY